MSTDDGASLGSHCLADLHGCPRARLSLPATELARVAREAAEAAGARVVETLAHDFPGGGATVVCLLAESHLSIHTWPERGAAAVDAFTCGAGVDPRIACERIARALAAERVDVRVIRRG